MGDDETRALFVVAHALGVPVTTVLAMPMLEFLGHLGYLNEQAEEAKRIEREAKMRGRR